MRWLLISDIHSNLEALDAVLRDAEARWGALHIACAGDVVGLGPSPNECVACLREREALCVPGNHDLMVLERLAPRCTPAGLRAVEWTRRHLDETARAWLSALPLVREAPGQFVLCHGSLVDADEYVVGDAAVGAQLRLLPARHPGFALVVHGHTHHPVWAPGGRVERPRAGARVRVDASLPTLVNPGSVGQSRTRECWARYAVLDTDAATLEYCAAPYDIGACTRKLRAAGLETQLYLTVGALWSRRCRRVTRRAGGWLANRLRA